MSYHNALSGISDGSGTALDPFGGQGGAAESDLAKLVKGGMKFFDPPNPKDKFQTGALNREKYVFVVASDKMFYKFKYPNSGIGNTPTDAKTQSWFNDVVKSNTPAAVTKIGAASTKTPPKTTKAPEPDVINRPITTTPTKNTSKAIVDVITKSPLPASNNLIPATTKSYIIPAVVGITALAVIIKVLRRKKTAAA